MSCKNEDKKITETIAGSCAVLTSTDIQDSWVNPGYTKPGDSNRIDTIDILASYNPVSTEFTIYVQGVKQGSGKVSGSNIKIFQGTSCKPPALTSIPLHNYFSIANLDILEKDGKLKKFNYIVFTPKEYQKDNDIMAFDLSVVNNDGTSQLKGQSLPCPPCYNCKPMPENCQIEPTDSTDN
ncbi:MAG TPA: hypothetical protein PKC72_07330 [Chitinophagaceae bacterium]|nr:hypothetical protein [Chitinophagaceae bacterium]